MLQINSKRNRLKNAINLSFFENTFNVTRKTKDIFFICFEYTIQEIEEIQG